MYKYPSQDFWKVFKETAGAFSTAEAIALYNICSKVKYGGVGDWCSDYLELGSHKGKSGLAAALGLPKGIFTLVDPIFEDHELAQSVCYKVKSVTDKLSVPYDSSISLDAIAKHKLLAYVFIDSGSHSDELPMQEAKMLEDRVAIGGVLAFHDKGSQFTKVDEAYYYLLSTGKYEQIEINWAEIFYHVKEQDLENGNNSWHQYPELSHPPNFIGALMRK